MHVLVMAVFVCVSAQVKVFVTGLFSLNQDIPAFKEHLRDFLVQIKVWLSIQLCGVFKSRLSETA